MELVLDRVPLRVDALFFAAVLGVLALSVMAVRAAAQRAGQAADLWTMRAATGAMLWLVATGLAGSRLVAQLLAILLRSLRS